MAGDFTKNRIIQYGAGVFFVLSLMLPLLWYPYYLRRKQPEKYRGTWKRIGDWMGDVNEAFPGR